MALTSCRNPLVVRYRHTTSSILLTLLSLALPAEMADLPQSMGAIGTDARSTPTSIATTPSPTTGPTPSTASHSTTSMKPLVNIEDYHAHARLHLPKAVYDFYRSGAHDESTLLDNVAAYQRLLIRPRFLVDVSRVSLTSTLLSHTVSSPIAVAPTAMQRMAHPDGELAMARAAASRHVLYALSSMSTTSLEDVAAAAPHHPARWYQLYVYRDRKITESLVRRAQAAGYSGLVLTIDVPLLGVREADARNQFSLPRHLQLGNFRSASEGAMEEGAGVGGSGLQSFVSRMYDRSLSWRDLAWLRSLSPLPLIVKGVMTAEDAELAVQHGVDAIIVSNHGARQLDSVASTLEALPEVIAAVQRARREGVREVEVYVDGGVRRGTDVFKALALGAKAVFVGRPVLWGLAYAGEEGVRQVLTLLHNELELAMALAGCPTIASINRSRLTTTTALRPNL